MNLKKLNKEFIASSIYKNDKFIINKSYLGYNVRYLNDDIYLKIGKMYQLTECIESFVSLEQAIEYILKNS